MFKDAISAMAGNTASGSSKSGEVVKNYYRYELPTYATQIMLQTNELCKDNIDKLYSNEPEPLNSAWVKRVIHWNMLSDIVTNCEEEHIGLVEKICTTFKSPKKWELDIKDFNEAFLGHCSYANFGTIYVRESGTYLVDTDGNKIWLAKRL